MYFVLYCYRTMNTLVIEWPRGTNLKLAIITSTPVLNEDFTTTVPARIQIDIANGTFESIPMEDPTPETDSSNDDSNSSSNTNDVDNSLDNDATESEADSMDVDANDVDDEDQEDDLITFTEIRV